MRPHYQFYLNFYFELKRLFWWLSLTLSIVFGSSTSHWLLVTNKCWLLVASSISSLCLTSKKSTIFHIGFQSLSALLHAVITVLNTYCMCSSVHIHTLCADACWKAASTQQKQKYRLSVLLFRCSVVPSVWMFDYSNEICLKTWLCGITMKLMMNYGCILLWEMKFSENNIVYWAGSLVCLSLITWASQVSHNLHNFSVTV